MDVSALARVWRPEGLVLTSGRVQNRGCDVPAMASHAVAGLIFDFRPPTRSREAKHKAG